MSAKSKKKEPKKYIICVDDEQIVLNAVKKQLQRATGAAYSCEFAESVKEAREVIEDIYADGDKVVMIISDQIMPSIKGDEFLVSVHKESPEIIKILLTGQAALESAVNAVNNADLFRYLTKPWDENDFVLTVKRGLERYELLGKLKEQARSFERFVPKQFLDSLSLTSYEAVEPNQAKKISFSVLFLDIRGFTSISEKMGPQKTFNFLNNLFGYFATAIVENKGFIDKYIGDAIMAIFISEPINAIKAALEIYAILDKINDADREAETFPVRIGIGINTGDAMIGVVGSKSRLDTTVIGDVVNSSARFEALTKKLGVTILVPENIYKECKNDKALANAIRCVYNSQVRGKKEVSKLYEIFPFEDKKTIKIKNQTRPHFEKAVELYAGGNIREAKTLFEKCLKISGKLDPTLHYYLDIINKGEDTGRAGDIAAENLLTYYNNIKHPPTVKPAQAAVKKKSKIKNKT